MTSSVALPIVIFSRAPSVSPKKLATSFVARHRTSARGMIARQFKANTAESPQPSKGAIMPKGTNRRRKLLQYFAVYFNPMKSAFLDRGTSLSMKLGDTNETLLWVRSHIGYMDIRRDFRMSLGWRCVPAPGPTVAIRECGNPLMATQQ
jgi:hypothetical protein